MGLFGLRTLGLVDNHYQPRFLNRDKRLLVIVETDGCGADGMSVATDCHVGRRTLRILDYGKMAASLVDIVTGQVVRVVPRGEARQLASVYAPSAVSLWHAYLEGYQIMPDEELLFVEKVRLTQTITQILSRPNARAICKECGEEIMNEREVCQNGRTLCRSCAGDNYYTRISSK
jgi:formylmethanofuran dehydrogenase subunit E